LTSTTKATAAQPPERPHRQGRIEGYLDRYKELIITTIICLFLTGIYDSINTQTAEIKRWYQLMVNLQAEQKIQSADLHELKKAIERHQARATVRLDEHEGRIRALEFEINPNQ